MMTLSDTTRGETAEVKQQFRPGFATDDATNVQPSSLQKAQPGLNTSHFPLESQP